MALERYPKDRLWQRVDQSVAILSSRSHPLLACMINNIHSIVFSADKRRAYAIRRDCSHGSTKLSMQCLTSDSQEIWVSLLSNLFSTTRIRCLSMSSTKNKLIYNDQSIDDNQWD